MLNAFNSTTPSLANDALYHLRMNKQFINRFGVIWFLGLKPKPTTMRPSTVVTVRIVIASLGVACGLLAGIPFAFHFRNYNAAGWSFVSSIFAAFVLILHIKHKNLTLRSWLPRLRTCMLVGCVGQLAGVSVMVAYISLAVVLGQNLRMLYGENYWIAWSGVG
ncbi:Heme transporter hrg-1 [Trichinella spiralis]|uniref:Heme transporter hrg-1 n=1 Tax=Trichinella spiralis TaxID=6334 RepID=A0ABR3KX80_TRISP